MKVDIWPIDIPVTDDFVISQGAVTTAENCFVRLELACGAVGYGEIAPFTDITGEDRSTSYKVAKNLSNHLINQSVATYRKLSGFMSEAEPNEPAARCGLETAILDAFCHALGIPLWAFWGGRCLDGFETDITIPILNTERSVKLIEHWFDLGFRVFKIKVGSELESDIKRIEKLNESKPNLSFILDANQGFTESEALRFIKEVKKLNCNIMLFEQPVAKDDLIGLAVIKDSCGVLVAADESVTTTVEAQKVILAKAADIINIKIMKSGVIEATRITEIARAAGMKLMFGGMVETRLAMGCSYAIALGLSGAEFLDLDTPLLLSEDPLSGGYKYVGPGMTIWTEPGLGMKPNQIPV